MMATSSSATNLGGAGKGGSDNPVGHGVRSARIRQRNTWSKPRDGSSGFILLITISLKPLMTVSKLLKSWATPPANVPANFAPSCSSLNGGGVHYSWNDMGGNPDDTDYNDGQYDFKCSSTGTPNTGVILTD